MNSDGLKPANSRARWASQYKRNANPEIKRASLQNLNGKPLAPRGTDSPPKAVRLPNTQAYVDKYAITTHLARYSPVGAEEGESGFQLKVYVYTPSTRLRCRVNVFFESDVDLGVDPSFATTPEWTIDAMAKNPYSGRESPLQQLYPPSAPGTFATPIQHAGGVSAGGTATAALPDSFAHDNAGELMRLNIQLDNNQFTSGYVDLATNSVNAMLVTTWEPNCEISPAELASFYRDCRVTYGRVPIIQHVSIP